MTFLKWFMGLVSVLLFTASQAQDYYAVQLGIFLNPRLSDFDDVRALGYLYAQEDGADTYRILLAILMRHNKQQR
ncbi:MAG: hypothetical protein HC912_02165 [Saprospiraceae bacterium]|nr:hypothetical protein [Saprospiraceae bacterium]